VSDILDEVEQELRRERAEKVWKRYAPWIIGFVVLVVAGVGGWRYYEWQQSTRAAALGERFEAALDDLDAGKLAEAEAALKAIRADAPPAVRTLARLAEANALANRDAAAGAAAFDAIAADATVDEVARELARVRAGHLLVDSASLADLKTRLEAATASGRAFRHSAREVIALAAYRSGEKTEARRWFDMIVADQEVPAGIRARADLMIALIDAEGRPAARP
jgi:hypothetical protein